MDSEWLRDWTDSVLDRLLCRFRPEENKALRFLVRREILRLQDAEGPSLLGRSGYAESSYLIQAEWEHRALPREAVTWEGLTDGQKGSLVFICAVYALAGGVRIGNRMIRVPPRRFVRIPIPHVRQRKRRG
jgi:hypothetical protein